MKKAKLQKVSKVYYHSYEKEGDMQKYTGIYTFVQKKYRKAKPEIKEIG